MYFDIENHKPRLPHYASIQIQVNHSSYAIWRTFVHEGASMCVMSIDFWKGLGSPTLIPSPTMLKEFYGRMFQPHGIIPMFFFELGEKMVEVKVEVVDAPLDYNILLGCSWTYAMEVVVSSVYRVIKLPHKGKVVTIEQLSFFHKESTRAKPDIPMIDNSSKESPNVGVGLYPSLMGNFNLPWLEDCMVS